MFRTAHPHHFFHNASIMIVLPKKHNQRMIPPKKYIYIRDHHMQCTGECKVMGQKKQTTTGWQQLPGWIRPTHDTRKGTVQRKKLQAGKVVVIFHAIGVIESESEFSQGSMMTT
jgi:hypothetical protein